MPIPSMVPDVAQAFQAIPEEARARLLALRRLIFETAATTDGVGALEETLKWGEPAYLTPISKSGSTIRLGWKPGDPDRCAIYFNCQTSLVATFRTLFSSELAFEGSRAIMLDRRDPLPEKPLAMCFAMALTYHHRKHAPAVWR